MSEFKLNSRRSSNNARMENAFTLTDLLVAMACVVVLGIMTIPSFARGQQKPQAMICLNNHRQLALAALMYAGDNRDTWLPNAYGYQPSWVAGNISWDNRSTDNTNVAKLMDAKYSLIAPYVKTFRVFKCPSDTSTVTNGPRVRSVSMSQSVGTIGLTGKPVYGEWLSGNRMSGGYSEWRTYGTTASMADPGPSMLFVFADEHPNSINDAGLAVQVGYTNEFATIIDFPANYHDGGCSFSFCDGHVEIHHWKGKKIQFSNARGAYPDPGASVVTAAPDSLEDVAWLQARTSAHR